MVIAAHADDETIGCGGTVAKYASQGSRVFVGVLTRDDDEATYKLRQAEAANAWAILGVSESAWAGARHHPMPHDHYLVETVANWIHKFQPEILMVPHPNEVDADHATVAPIVKNAFARAGLWPHLLGYEVWTPLRGAALSEDISSTMTTKIKAIREYRSQLADRQYDDAAEGLARYRGVMSGRGQHVEVFSVLEQ